ncbi:MAG: hypothetical protein ACR2MS_09485 [Weeksellaceae bacterium]
MHLTEPWILAIIFALASLLHGISGLGVISLMSDRIAFWVEFPL